MSSSPFSFDAEVAAAAAAPAAGGAVPIELPPNLQRHGVLWPTPAEQVSDHSAEGAPWKATARDIPTDPPQGPMPMGDHRGPSVPYLAQVFPDARTGSDIGAPATGNHYDDGKAWFQESRSPVVGGAPRIGKPFTVDQGSREQRGLKTDTWDGTGKRLTPPDAPSAPHQLYGSQHYTRPRLTPYEVAPLATWAWPQGPSFTNDPGYYGVMGYEPDLSQRPRGSVAAQMPDDPYVANAVPQAVSTGFAPDFYDLGI